MKKCTKCGEKKSLDAFYVARIGIRGRPIYRPSCKTCFNAAAAKWQKANPDKVRASNRREWLGREYGMTVDHFSTMSERQAGRCAICGREAKLVVDHCHATGNVRGLLCNNCNAGIGFLQDNPVILESAIRYITGGR